MKSILLMMLIHETDTIVSVNLAGLDMNLVVALRALLTERNVTRAGERIGLESACDERRTRPAAPPLR